MKLELFFDYICPYCYRGHRMFLELLPLYPGLEVVWRPARPPPARKIPSGPATWPSRAWNTWRSGAAISSPIPGWCTRATLERAWILSFNNI